MLRSENLVSSNEDKIIWSRDEITGFGGKVIVKNYLITSSDNIVTSTDNLIVS